MTRHPLSVAGALLTSVSALIFVFVFLVDLFGFHSNPYFGLVFFVILPVVFVLGLVMIPVGAVLERRRQRLGLAPHRVPRIDLADPPISASWVSCFALTIVNLLIVSLAAYRGVEYMDSPQFCGQVCHTVMEPEYVAHATGRTRAWPASSATSAPARRGSCYSKLTGLRQLASRCRTAIRAPFRRRFTTCGRRARPASSATGPRSSTATRSDVIPRVRQRREEHRVGDRDAGSAHRRRQRAGRPRRRAFTGT